MTGRYDPPGLVLLSFSLPEVVASIEGCNARTGGGGGAGGSGDAHLAFGCCIDW